MKPETKKFDFRQGITVVRFGASDIEPDPGHLKDFKRIVEECDDNYPGIDLWFEKKVKPGLRDKERAGILIYHNDEPVGASIVRRGDDGKLCSLRIENDYQKWGLGKLLMALTILDFKSSSEVHFSIPASLWESKTGFFEKYGFHLTGKCKTQYRKGDDELLCAGPFKNALNQVIKDIPEIFDTFSINQKRDIAKLILSIKPDFANKIVSGRKTVELRRRFSKKWEGAKAILYATHPNQAFVGEVKINKIISGKPIDIWYEYRDFLGCDRDTYFSYCERLDVINALLLSDVKPYGFPININSINMIFEKAYSQKRDITVPQSHCRIENELLYPLAVLYSGLFNFDLRLR